MCSDAGRALTPTLSLRQVDAQSREASREAGDIRAELESTRDDLSAQIGARHSEATEMATEMVAVSAREAREAREALGAKIDAKVDANLVSASLPPSCHPHPHPIQDRCQPGELP